MSFDTSWDINKYMDKTEYELHWEMRKSFMEAHKHKYPEDRLVALSKVFANMEFMGCIYNSELMVLVKNLAKQVDDILQYRKDRTTKISRTFVKASDAAKKNKNPPKLLANKNNPKNNKRKPELVEFDETDDSMFERKRFKQEKFNSNNSNERKIENEEDWKLFKKARAQKGVKGKFIIHESGAEDHKETLIKSAAKSKLKLEYCTEPHAKKLNFKIHRIKLNEEICAQIESEQKMDSVIKTELSTMALKELKKYCFTITPTNNVEKVGKQLTDKRNESADENCMQGGIGAKIMKLMGWKGEGLGKNATGIQEPIEAATLQVNKAGLGMEKTDAGFYKTMRTYLKDYLKSNEKRPLQFSSSFTKEERATIHTLAQKMPLKTKSSGKGEQRQLKVEKKISEWDLIEDLLGNGGYSVAYTLVKPTAL